MHVVLRRSVAAILFAGAGLLVVRPCVAADVPARPKGITVKTQSAIDKALAYLARTQARDGRWQSGGMYGSGGYPCVMTSLAGLAFLSAGHTPVEGKYAKNVQRATAFILRQADRTGLICIPGQTARSMYGHGFSMLFLAQVLGMDPDPTRQKRIRLVLQRAVMLTARSQSRYGGWTYNPNTNSDEGSVTITQIQGLRACRNAGIKVPKKTIDRACEYVQKCANKDGGISYSYASRGSSRPAITAAAVATMYNAGQYENPVALGALRFVQNQIKKSKGDPWQAFRGHAFYALLYVSQAMWFTGEKEWEAFFPSVRDHLLKTQGGDGSWNGDYVGQTYGTAIGLIILQLPNQYLPILQR